MGISLYNKVLDQMKLKENCNSFEKDLESFLLMNSCSFTFELCVRVSLFLQNYNDHVFQLTNIILGILACGIMYLFYFYCCILYVCDAHTICT
jgi:hypothetical protein